MSVIKPFILGFACAYGVQRITRKRADGTSPLSDFLDHPPSILRYLGIYIDNKIEHALVPQNDEQFDTGLTLPAEIVLEHGKI